MPPSSAAPPPIGGAAAAGVADAVLSTSSDLQLQLAAMLADLLDYPTDELAARTAACERLAVVLAPDATAALHTFAEFTASTPLGRLEEIYTAFFDLNPICYPYIGHLLFGESYKRSAFLVALGERYRAYAFALDDAELADRLSNVLRFVAFCPDPEERRIIATEAVLPALERLAAGGSTEPVAPPLGADNGPQLEGHSEGEVLAPGYLLGITEQATADADLDQHPYRALLRAAHLLLRSAWPPGDASDETS